jgi:superfamily I DNA/RNA helicase
MEILQVADPHKHTPGPTLLLAGPSSGKTHSLAQLSRFDAMRDSK